MNLFKAETWQEKQRSENVGLGETDMDSNDLPEESTTLM